MNNKKQILIVNGHLNVGGVERSLVELLRHFNYNKYNVDLLLLEGLGDYVDEIPKEVKINTFHTRSTDGPILKVLYHSFKTKNWFAIKYRLILQFMRFSKKLAFLLLVKTLNVNHKYEIAIAYRTGFIADFVGLGIRSSKKICWWHHGCIKTPNEVIQLLLFDKIITVSNGVKQLLLNVNSQLESRIKIIPNIIDVEKICHMRELSSTPCDDFKGIKFITVGRFSIEKHFENVVYAAARLKADKLFNFKWYIVGDGELYAQIEKLILKFSVSDVVILCGRKSNPYPYIKHADIMVHTSHVESQGLVIQEAMALGIPCVITRSIGPSEFIIDGENGIMVEPNVDSLIKGIYRFVYDKNLLKKIANNGKLTILQKYNPKSIIRQFEETINDIFK